MGEEPESGTVVNTQTETPITLEPGAWTITVKAWAGTVPEEPEDGDAPKPAFTGGARLHVYAGTAEPFAVGLHPNTEGGGTFSYSVTFGTGLTSLGYAFIGIYPLDGGPVADVIDLIGPNTITANQAVTGTAQLPAGYYNIATSVNYKDSDTQKFATKREVLYIYDGLTSSYTETFATGDFTALLPAKTEGHDHTRTFNNAAAANSFWSTTSTRALNSVLANLPQNTPDTPYLVAVGTFAFGNTNKNYNLELGTIADPLENLFHVTQGRYVFYDLSECGSTAIPETKTYAYLARTYADRVTGIILPNAVVTIGTFAFNGLSSLTHITLPSSLTSFGNSVFSGCKSLSFIDIPVGVTSLTNNLFANSGLKSITLRYASGTVSVSSSTFGSVNVNYQNAPPIEAVYVPQAQIAGYKTEAVKSNGGWSVAFGQYLYRHGINAAGSASVLDDFFKAIPTD
jgi:hypothetical protein